MNLWLPDVTVLPSTGGGSMAGGPARKALWHRTVGGTFASNANYLANIGNEPHILWDPRTGELGQFIAADRSSKALKNARGGVETNRVGTLCVQIEVVDRGETFIVTDTPMLGGDRLMTWLRDLGIPDVMPGGPFPPLGFTAHVSSQMWTTASGHFSHSQAPENDHTDPGLMDPARLFALGTVTAQHVPSTPVPEDDDMDPVTQQKINDLHVWMSGMKDRGYDTPGDPIDAPRLVRDLHATLPILRGLADRDAAAVAEHIPDDLAQQVADELAKRLTSPKES